MRVTLEPVKHTYKDQKGQFYKSVSAIIADYKHPFDPHKVMPDGGTLIGNYVKKNGQSEQYWLEAWEKGKNKACEKGTAFHDLKEMVVNNQPYMVRDNSILKVQNINVQWQIPQHEGLFDLLWPGVYTELCLWNYRHRVAGTADVVTIYADRTFDIDDYKTNGEFKTESFRGACMKYPCTNLPDCHKGHYTLQLSIYAWMLIQFGLTPRKLRIHHYDIPDEEVGKIIHEGILPEIEPTIHEVPYAEQEVEWIMQERLTQLRKQRR